MTLHPIDTVKKEWSDDDLDRMLTFCLLDRASPYPTVCRCFNLLDDCGMTTRAYVKKQYYPYKEEAYIENRLRLGGYRFPNQAAKYIIEFSNNPINLRTCTREELVESVKGIGYKLASMFLRNTRGIQYAVIDVHIKNWLTEHGHNIKKLTYKQMEDIFLAEAKLRGKTPYDFDMEIWEERRRKFKE